MLRDRKQQKVNHFSSFPVSAERCHLHRFLCQVSQSFVIIQSKKQNDFPF